MTARGFELEVTGFGGGFVASSEAVSGVTSSMAERRVLVVVLDEGDDDTIGLFASSGSILADGIDQKGLVPALDLPPA
ncbi:MAG: hypothetical protein IPI35_26305 [Deltaproteobacteria bacterium]|nr:hypothetical protein [Deltaproteobacteria bacterium]